MKASDLLALFERMYAEHWPYEWGAAREGCVDCSGAFVWAFKQFGQSIFHGSNTIARAHVVGGMRPISQARSGWALFKHAFDGKEPDKYKADGLGNYKHIALCSRDGKHALNAKGEKYGFCSESLSGYKYAAPLLGVEYEEDEEMDVLYKALVTTAKDPLRVRSAPETGEVIDHVPRGETVEVLKEGRWPFIRYWSVTGYVSGEYLTRIYDGAGGIDHGVEDKPDGGDTVTIPRALAEQLYRALGEQLSVD